MDHTSQDILDRITRELAEYQPSETTVELVQKTPIVLLVGITGAGKDTVKHKLLESGEYHHIVSHTTRMPRANKGVAEQDGVDYHFVSLEEAHRMASAGEFVEAKFVHGTVYGTSVEEIRKAQADEKIALTDVDVQGVAEYKQISENVIAIFLLPPDYETWQQRFIARYGAEGVEKGEAERRMQSAVRELEHALHTDYYHFVVNDDLVEAAHTADQIAHNHDQFNKKDDEARAKATALLETIKRYVA